MKITVFSDYICPFCYIGIETLRSVQSEVPPFTLTWKGFQIHPEYPASGLPMEQRVAKYGQKRYDKERYAAVWQNILSLADNIGLTMQPPPVLTNSRIALEATEYAQKNGQAEAFAQAVYQAYFQHGKNIGDLEIVLSLAEEVGLYRAELHDHLLSGTYTDRIQTAQKEAHELGVSGVPTFVVGPAQIVGAQSPDVVINMLNRVAERGLA